MFNEIKNKAQKSEKAPVFN